MTSQNPHYSNPNPETSPSGDANSGRMANLAQDIQRLELTLKPELERLQEEYHSLLGRTNFLMGLLLVLIVVFGSALGWSIYRIQGLDRQEQQNNGVADGNLSERIQQLEQQLQSFPQQGPETLANQLQANQEQVQQVRDQLQTMQTEIQTLKALSTGSQSNQKQQEPSKPLSEIPTQKPANSTSPSSTESPVTSSPSP